MRESAFVSIIIPLVGINDYFLESYPHLLALDYENYEIIVLPDKPVSEDFQGIKIIPTGRVSPAIKRDIGAENANGELLFFLDDDSYPEKDWISKALPYFNDSSVAAIGGPAITPPGDSFFQKVSGAVFLTKVGGGIPERYYPADKTKEVDDWPSVNLIVRKEMFIKIGGFKSEYWPGEDTKLCLEIIKEGGKILYAPDVAVWHHRRSGLLRHLKQIGNYGIHRGFFAKRYPETSFKLLYFIPSFFVLYLCLFTVSLFFFSGSAYYLSFGFVLYAGALIYAFFDINRKVKDFRISLVSLYYIVLTHIWYGIRFFYGFVFVKELKSKLR
ncbi:MAG: glycosyltransferase [Deltaproteobacteria bacterium]|nr:glycosyltransferase [Deltaproteobacteria bacterium]